MLGRKLRPLHVQLRPHVGADAFDRTSDLPIQSDCRCLVGLGHSAAVFSPAMIDHCEELCSFDPPLGGGLSQLFQFLRNLVVLLQFGIERLNINHCLIQQLGQCRYRLTQTIRGA